MGSKRFPLFIDLTGKSAVVIGGGAVGLRRAEVLRQFGAEVTVVSPSPACLPAGICHVNRAYEAGDLAGAALAIAATDCPEVNAAVGREARQRGIPFNRSDCPDGCDFFFPAICEGRGLVAGVIGDGSDHSRTAQAAQKIRETLDSFS